MPEVAAWNSQESHRVHIMDALTAWPHSSSILDTILRGEVRRDPSIRGRKYTFLVQSHLDISDWDRGQFHRLLGPCSSNQRALSHCTWVPCPEHPGGVLVGATCVLRLGGAQKPGEEGIQMRSFHNSGLAFFSVIPCWALSRL